jgi:hypothetical protein
VQRFHFNISPSSPLLSLLPVAPKVAKLAGPVLGEDLAQVPEIEFQAPPTKKSASEDATKNTAFLIAKINHLNGKKPEGFLLALRDNRTDLTGLPFAMGDACRTKGERSKLFAQAVATVRSALQSGQQMGISATTGAAIGPGVGTPVGSAAGVPATFGLGGTMIREGGILDGFWEQYQATCAQEDKGQSPADRTHGDLVLSTRIAALMQILAPEAPSVRLGLVRYLSTVSHVEATKALARLAIFSAEEEVQKAAVEALKVRRERDYTEVLVQGLRYPWPPVARRAADAIAKLERSDLLPQLVGVLEEPDPRAPVVQETNQKKSTVVRELVRLNHHRSCLLCHAPGNTGTVSPDALVAEVPVPGQPLASPLEGYRTTVPDILVRVDVTYLRQDFSVREAVEDANPWPEMQRFDFLVRTRTLTNEEADAYREKLERREPGRLSPYHSAVLATLRLMTGKDTEPTAAAWRRLLELPARN